MIKKLLNYFFILLVVTSASFAFSMEKESKKDVASLTTIATRKNAKILWDLLQKDPSQFLIKLNEFAQRLPQETLLPIINFNLQSIDKTFPKSLLFAVMNNFRIIKTNLAKSSSLEETKKLNINLENNILFMNRLIELGADVKGMDEKENTVLALAFLALPENQQSLSILKNIVNAGADVNEGKTIIAAALKPFFIKFIIDSGYNVNQFIAEDRTPLDVMDGILENAIAHKLQRQTENILKSIEILQNAGAKRAKDLKK